MEALLLHPAELEARVLNEHLGGELRRAARGGEYERGLPLGVRRYLMGRNSMHYKHKIHENVQKRKFREAF